MKWKTYCEAADALKLRCLSKESDRVQPNPQEGDREPENVTKKYDNGIDLCNSDLESSRC